MIEAVGVAGGFRRRLQARASLSPCALVSAPRARTEREGVGRLGDRRGWGGVRCGAERGGGLKGAVVGGFAAGCQRRFAPRGWGFGGGHLTTNDI